MSISNDHTPSARAVELADQLRDKATSNLEAEQQWAVLEVAGSKYSGAWWADTADRVVSTTAQGAIAYIGAGAIGVLDIDYVAMASVAGLAGVLAFLKALAVTRAR